MENSVQSELVLLIGAGMLIMVGLALVMVFYSSRAQRRIMAQQMDAQAREIRYQQELVQHNLRTQEEERKRIAAQLHDDIGSKLGVLHLSFHRLRRTGSEHPEYEPLFGEINGLIANTLDATRRISHDLLPPTLEDFGLYEALRECCDAVRKTGALELELDYQLERADIPDASTELNLFRIIQELINNTLKYAHASNIYIWIGVQDAGPGRRLCYRDDGQGFDPHALERKGLGLKNLENRVRIIGGHWTLKTAPGQGFEANVQF